jgi:hypothetical protein
MADTDNDNGGLGQMFAQARQGAEPMPKGLAQRIIADAGQVQAAIAKVGAPLKRPGAWRQFLSLVGGWPALGGLATACAAGIWIGMAPPSFLPDPAQLVGGTGSEIDLIDIDNLFAALSEEE